MVPDLQPREQRAAYPGELWRHARIVPDRGEFGVRPAGQAGGGGASAPIRTVSAIPSAFAVASVRSHVASAE